MLLAGFFLVNLLYSFLFDSIMRLLSSEHFLIKLRSVEINDLFGPILNQSKFLVYQFQLVNFLQRCTEPFLGVDVFSFVVRGCLMLKLIAKTHLIFKNATLISLCFKVDIFSDPFQIK